MQMNNNNHIDQHTNDNRVIKITGSSLTRSRNMSRSPSSLASTRPSRVALQATVFVAIACYLAISGGVEARLSFEKMTNRDYSGVTYYTIQNVSLFECLGWCKDESSCTSAVFSFVVNPFAALQETSCQLQNETQARQVAHLRQLPLGLLLDQPGSSSGGGGGGGGGGGATAGLVAAPQPQKATNLYFFNKIDLPSEAVCARLWAFERFPNRKLRFARDKAPFHAPSKEACQAACMNEQRFVCRSLEYNYLSQQCTLSALDRRSPLILHLSASGSSSGLMTTPSSLNAGNSQTDLIESTGTDYFENACLLGEDICNESRVYDYAKVGLPAQRVAHFVELNYYPDKEMLVKSQAGCLRACTIEHEFICRSILYRSSFKQGQPNCALYHLDQRTFPDGADTFLGHHLMQPLLDSGETSAVYLEAVCNDSYVTTGSSGSSSLTLPISQHLLTTTAATSASSSNNMASTTTAASLGASTASLSSITLPPSSITLHPSPTGNGHMHLVSSHPLNGSHSVMLTTSSSSGSQNSLSSTHSPLPSSSELERFVAAASSTLSPLAILGSGPTGNGPSTIRLPSSVFGGPNQPPPGSIQIQSAGSASSAMPPQHITFGPTSGGRPQPPQHITIGPAGSPNRDQGSQATMVLSDGPLHPVGSHEQNCDAHGFCYDVSLKCTDTKMVVNVRTQRPFHGRIYALGRSETCNANIKNQNQFQLDMYLTGQECNTQSASGTYTNTIVLQHHNVVLTKADKVYHVRCTYETASRNVTFGMMPVKDMFEVDVNDRNQETISITASSDAPLPKISILTGEGKEASTVRIGDRLTFRIEIPDNTPYGIFARSCVAMAKDARSTFEIIDEHGCPVDHTIFPNFLPVANGNALESSYEAFRFTESYGVIFQCNVKYCIGRCEPVNCNLGRETVEAWGRKKRSIAPPDGSAAKGEGKQVGDDMTLSREIVVLDLKENGAEAPESASLDNGDGDPSSSVTERIPPELPAPVGQKVSHAQQSRTNNNNNNIQTQTNKHCLSSQSLVVLICSIGLFFVLYVCVVAYFFARRDHKISTIKHQYH